MGFIDIKRLIRLSPLHNSRLYHNLRYELKKGGCDKVITDFVGPNIEQDRRDQIKRNMRNAMVRYHWDFDEYFLFNYEGCTHAQRKKFVPEYDKNVFCDQVNQAEDASVFNSKWKTYEVFKNYFNRPAILVSDLSDVDSEAVEMFISKHNSFIMKPLYDACGHGIHIVKEESKLAAKNRMISILQSGNSAYIVEELIDQVPEMAELHPESVNTVRIPTFNIKGDIEVVRPFLRSGCGKSVVDNAGSGGVFALIDPKTGVTYAAADEHNRSFIEHPDSHKLLVGFQVPKWNEAVGMVKELARVLPDVKYVGWDLALTKKGWVLVEGNDKGQFVFQYPLHEGFREELNDLRKRM